MRPGSLPRAAVVLLAASLAGLVGGCRSTPEGVPGRAPQAVVLGAPPEDLPELRAAIDGLIEDFERRGRAPSYLDDAAFELREFYRRRGHAFAEARYLPPTPEGPAVFEVDPGPRIVLADFRVDGALWLGRQQAAAVWDFPDGSLSGVPVRWFTREALDAGLRALEDRYYSEGFLEVSASVVSVDLDPLAGEARVVVDLVEGPRFRVRRTEVRGDVRGLEPLVREALDATSDRPFTPRSVYGLRTDLLERLGNAGYPDAFVDVEATVDREIGAADLAIAIDPGVPVTVADVRIEGAGSTRRKFVLSRLRLRPGDRYSRERARESFERLFRTGLFDRVAVRLEDGSGRRRDLIVELAERPSQELYVEPGYGAYELARFKAGYRELNLFGTGRQLRVEAVASVRSLGAEVGVSDPDFFDVDLLADLTLGYEDREEPSFQRTELSGTFRLRWPWIENVDGNLAYEYRQIELADVDIAVDNELVALEDLDVSSILFSPQYDSRDNIFVPTTGSTGEIGVEWASAAFGSEIDFVRTTLTGTHYVSFDADGETVLALGARLGWIAPSGDTDLIPLQERFFNGGPTTVRAFPRYELGPADGEGNPIGGEGQTIFNVELRRRIRGNLHGALFYDAGSVVLEDSDLLDLDGYAGGPGFGLRYLLPIGPLRFDVAFNLDPGADEDGFVIHAAVGMPF